jgi:hypothetical protein
MAVVGKRQVHNSIITYIYIADKNCFGTKYDYHSSYLIALSTFFFQVIIYKKIQMIHFHCFYQHYNTWKMCPHCRPIHLNIHVVDIKINKIPKHFR